MKNYTITLNKEQLILVANCLEDISRFADGQCKLDHTVSKILKGLPHKEYIQRRDEAQEVLSIIGGILLPNSYQGGYNSTEFIGNTYQIYKSILHHIAVEDNWNNVHSSPPLPSGNLGTIKIETK